MHGVIVSACEWLDDTDGAFTVIVTNGSDSCGLL